MNDSKWGFSTIGCPTLSLQDAADLGLKSGYPVMEVRISGTEFADRELLKELAAQKRCFILGTSFRILSDSDEFREQLKFCALLAAECGIPWVRVFGGYDFDEQVSDSIYDAARRNLEFLDQLNIPVQPVLETHDHLSSSTRILELFRRVGRNLPIIWDSYHTWNLAKETPAETWNRLKDFIVDVHLKDGTPNGLTVAGKGNYPLTELLTLLKENGYKGLLTCEHEKMWRKELPELPEAFAALDPYKKIME